MGEKMEKKRIFFFNVAVSGKIAGGVCQPHSWLTEKT